MLPSRRTILAKSARTAAAVAASTTLLNSVGRPFCQAADVGAMDKNDQFDEMTDASRRAIQRGNEWMLKAINKDGGAGLDIGSESDVACSSVVGMSLLSQGNTPDQGDLSYYQKRCAQFLLSRVEKMKSSGSLQNSQSIIEGDLGPYATHFFCTIYLSQVIGEAPNVKRYQTALRRLEKFISANQHKDGSWGEDAWAPMLATACGWISLRAANFSGIKVSGSSQLAGDFMIKKMPTLGRSWGSGSWYHRLYGTAAGLRVLYAIQREEDPKAKKALEDILALVEKNGRAFGGAGGEEYLTFHFLTEMFIQKGGPQWKRWYPIVRDRLLKVQNRDGSWTGHHCITSRTFSTACAMMVLTAPNRFLPISQV